MGNAHRHEFVCELELFDGEHSFTLEPLPAGGTRLTQAEQFSGLLVRPFARSLDRTEGLQGDEPSAEDAR